MQKSIFYYKATIKEIFLSRHQKNISKDLFFKLFYLSYMYPPFPHINSRNRADINGGMRNFTGKIVSCDMRCWKCTDLIMKETNL